jgi:hypothetical protein
MFNLKKLKKAGLVVLALTIMLSMSGCIFAQGNSHSDARDSVVMIVSDAGIGTGFAIGKPGQPIEYIVTNYHVVGESDNVYVYFSYAQNDFYMAQIFRSNRDKDLAVLKLPTATTKRVAMILSPVRSTDIDGQFWAFGFPWVGDQAGGQDYIPFDHRSIVSTTGNIQKEAVRVTNPIVTDTDVYMLGLDIHGGNSGGPLVNSRGEVVGINTFTHTVVNEETGEEVKVDFAVTIDELIRMIDRNEIPYTLVGDLVVQNVIILAGIAIVVILGAVALILILTHSGKKKPVPVAAGQAVANIPAPQPSVRTFIRATGGYFSGRNFDISGRLIIGRDSSKCTIAFPVDTAGISGVHCEIYMEGSTAYLRDLGSSYGTFLSNGTKLPPKSPQRLNNGDRFYVADAENTFEFSMM